MSLDWEVGRSLWWVGPAFQKWKEQGTSLRNNFRIYQKHGQVQQSYSCWQGARCNSLAKLCCVGRAFFKIWRKLWCCLGQKVPRCHGSNWCSFVNWRPKREMLARNNNSKMNPTSHPNGDTQNLHPDPDGRTLIWASAPCWRQDQSCVCQNEEKR